jgi:hypothetical protein
MTVAIESPAPAPAKRTSKAARGAARNAETSVDVPSAAVSEPEAAPKSDDRYPEVEVAQRVAARVKAARDAGWSRTRLEELVEAEGGSMKGAALWRAEQGRVHREELTYLVPVLDKIESGELALPEKPVKDPKALQARVNAALELLAGRAEAKKLADKSELLEDVYEALTA